MIFTALFTRMFLFLVIILICGQFGYVQHNLGHLPAPRIYEAPKRSKGSLRCADAALLSTKFWAMIHCDPPPKKCLQCSTLLDFHPWLFFWLVQAVGKGSQVWTFHINISVANLFRWHLAWDSAKQTGILTGTMDMGLSEIGCPRISWLIIIFTHYHH